MAQQSKQGWFDVLSGDATTTSLTAVDVPQMQFDLPVGGEIWHFEYVLAIGSTSAAGLKIAISVPPGASFRAVAFGASSSATAFQSDFMTSSGTLGAAFATVNANGLYLNIKGGVINGNFAGMLKLQAAKVTSGTATLFAGSFFTATQL
jgi:hypothetical protein